MTNGQMKGLLKWIFHEVLTSDDERYHFLCSIGICFFCGSDIRINSCYCTPRRLSSHKHKKPMASFRVALVLASRIASS